MTDDEFKYIGKGIFKNKFELTVLRLLWCIAVKDIKHFEQRRGYLSRLEKELF